MKPLREEVVIKKEIQEEKTNTGIYTGQTNKQTSGVVLYVGPNVKHIAVGNTIVFDKDSVLEQKVNNESVLFINESEVLATIEQ